MLPCTEKKSLAEEQVQWRGYYEDDETSDSIKGGARKYYNNFVCR
jgi:hypothetical protein